MDATRIRRDQLKYLLIVAAKSLLFCKIEYDRSERRTKTFIHEKPYQPSKQVI